MIFKVFPNTFTFRAPRVAGQSWMIICTCITTMKTGLFLVPAKKDPTLLQAHTERASFDLRVEFRSLGRGAYRTSTGGIFVLEDPRSKLVDLKASRVLPTLKAHSKRILCSASGVRENSVSPSSKGNQPDWKQVESKRHRQRRSH